MKGNKIKMCLLCIVLTWSLWTPPASYAEIAADNAFEGAVWEIIIEDKLEAPRGVVQSVCATEDYIITMENFQDGSFEPDIIKAFYRNDVDPEGNPVEKYSLAKRVQDFDYEHANGMAYNPHTKEIAVSLYTNDRPENRGCIFIMDAETLSYKRTVKITDEYNVLGIGYDPDKNQYVIQTNKEKQYSFKILDADFNIIGDLGEYADTCQGSNFQDLHVSGDYIINLPLTLGSGVGNFINMYSIERRGMVSAAQPDFDLANIVWNEPESICELEPGVFIAAVNVTDTAGNRSSRLYKTMVPYNFAAADVTPTSPTPGEESIDKPVMANAGTVAEEVNSVSQANTILLQKALFSRIGGLFNTLQMRITAIVILLFAGLILLYMRVLYARRMRERRRQASRRERERLRTVEFEYPLY